MLLNKAMQKLSAKLSKGGPHWNSEKGVRGDSLRFLDERMSSRLKKFDHCFIHEWRNLYQSGAQVQVKKTIESFCGLNWQL